MTRAKPISGILAITGLAASLSAIATCTQGATQSPSDTLDSAPGQSCALSSEHDIGWATRARVASVRVDPGTPFEDLDAAFDRLARRYASVVLLTGLFDGRFDEPAFSDALVLLADLVCAGHEAGLRIAAAMPALRVRGLVPGAGDDVQVGIDGRLNAVSPGKSDAATWMCPNGPHGDRVAEAAVRIVKTGVDALYLTDLMFFGEGTSWACACRHCARAFANWSMRMGLGGPGGLDVPREADFHDQAFRAWLRWRHLTLADFAQRLSGVVKGQNPSVRVFVKDGNLDGLRATDNGLDACFFRSPADISHSWDLEPVSSKTGMKWASPEDFTSRLAMLAWGRSADGVNPSWAIINGFGEEDSNLAMGSLLSQGLAPIDAARDRGRSDTRTSFAQRWFLAGAARPDLLPGGRRSSSVGLWYSSATRDYLDYPEAGGRTGSYVTAVPPVEDDGWWTDDPGDGCGLVPHLGEWRGAAHALTMLQVPYTPLLSGSTIPPDTDGLDAIWLPHVSSLSDREIETLQRFVSDGGFLFATGSMPGEIDQFGFGRRHNPMMSMFGIRSDERVLDHVNRFGKGLAVIRMEDLGADTLESVSGKDEASIAIPEIERWFGIHADGDVRVKGPRWIHVEESVESAAKRTLYIVNFNGLERPLRRYIAPIEVLVDAPEGYLLTAVDGIYPGGVGRDIRFARASRRTWSISLLVGAFAILDLRFAPEPPGKATADYAPPVFSDFIRESAARLGIRFVLDRMRNTVLPKPLSFGVRSSIPDGETVTARDMGLLLRATACLDMPREWDHALRYVREVMTSRAFRVPVRAVRLIDGRSVPEQSVFRGVWNESDSPADGLRIVRGIAEGVARFDRPSAQAFLDSMFNGMFFTDVIRREDMGALEFPGYPGGLIGAAWKWEGIDDDTLNPASRAGGHGDTDTDVIPLENQDLNAIYLGSESDPAWKGVLESAFDFLLDGEVSGYGPATGLFWGGMDGFTGAFTGDHRHQDSIHGRHLATEQVLRTALHLARASRNRDLPSEDTYRRAASEAARRTLRFFNIFHDATGRIPEYLTKEGHDVPDCLGDRLPDCLYHGIDNHFEGDVRVYSVAARLALEIGDRAFAAHLVEKHILTDRDDDPSSPLYGGFGVSTSRTGAATATDTLESVLTLCMEARSGRGGR